MRGNASSIAERILRALSQGQAHKRMLCERLNCDYLSIDPTVTELWRRRDIVVLGTAREAGYTDVRASAPVYGLPGMTLQRVPKKVRSSSSSNVVAGPIVIGRRMMQRW